MKKYIPKKILLRDKDGNFQPILALKGDTGKQGEQGIQGDTYTLTEQDKYQIAQTVKEEYSDVLSAVFSYDDDTHTLTITTKNGSTN